MNELTLRIEQNPGNIELNFDELEEALDAKLADYKGAVFTEESKGVAKSEVAGLRKLKKEIDDARKGVKKQWMKPYEEFESRMKSLISKVDEPINCIDQQLKEFEDRRRSEKKKVIEDIYTKLEAEYGDIAGYVPLDKIYDVKWENATASAKSITEAIASRMEAAALSVNSIKAMYSDKEDDALALYKNTLDYGQALQMITTYEQNKKEALQREAERRRSEEEQQRQLEIERAKAAERDAIVREERARAEERARIQEEQKTVKEEKVDIPEDELPFVQPSTITAFYRVVATPEELERVEMAFNSIGIYFERRDA